mmetsp:Transcript_32971/g.101849  ORF Transcript_32971/g.101849 Transcript_32971/m.101849 type:complete len:297 (+) Transcript_32971:269-1159(+)
MHLAVVADGRHDAALAVLDEGELDAVTGLEPAVCVLGVGGPRIDDDVGAEALAAHLRDAARGADLRNGLPRHHHDGRQVGSEHLVPRRENLPLGVARGPAVAAAEAVVQAHRLPDALGEPLRGDVALVEGRPLRAPQGELDHVLLVHLEAAVVDRERDDERLPGVLRVVAVEGDFEVPRLSVHGWDDAGELRAVAHRDDGRRVALLEHHPLAVVMQAALGEFPRLRREAAAALDREDEELFDDRVRSALGDGLPAALPQVEGNSTDAQGAGGEPLEATRTGVVFVCGRHAADWCQS